MPDPQIDPQMDPQIDPQMDPQIDPEIDPVISMVASTGFTYEVVPCDPDLADTTAFCDAYGFRPDQSANAIMVVGKGDPRSYVVCLVLATTRLDVNGAVRKRLAVKKASFASADETAEMTGMQIGGVTPYGLPPGLAIWIDSRVMACDQVIVGGGSRDRKLLVPPASLAALPNAEVVEGLAKPYEEAVERTSQHAEPNPSARSERPSPIPPPDSELERALVRRDEPELSSDNER